MPDRSPDDAQMGATPALLGRLEPPLRDLLRELLLHKSLFVSDWFLTLAAHDDAEEARVFRRIGTETLHEGREASAELEAWSRVHVDPDRTERVADEVRQTLIQALIALKEASTEAFLHAAMNAPTERIRDNLTNLADIDRRHADELRVVLGTATVADKLAKARAMERDLACGAHQGRYLPGTLGQSVRRTLVRLRERDAEPTRIIVSAESLRHLRDEGLVEENTVLGLPVDVEMSWAGEGFAVLTGERVTLAEIITAQTLEDAKE